MRRGDVCQPRASLRQFRYNQALLVGPSAYHQCAMSEQATQRRWVVWILDNHAITRIQKYSLDDGKRLLRASDHQNVGGITLDSAASP